MRSLDDSTLDLLEGALPSVEWQGKDARMHGDHLHSKDASQINPGSIYCETFTGDIILDEGRVLKVIGRHLGPYHLNDQDSYVDNLLALDLGTVSFVRQKLAGSTLQQVHALYKGEEKNGVTWARSPRITKDMDMSRLICYVNFKVSFYFIEPHRHNELWPLLSI